MMISLEDYNRFKEINNVLWDALDIGNLNIDCFVEGSSDFKKYFEKGISLEFEILEQKKNNISLFDYYKVKEINETLWKALNIAKSNFDWFEDRSADFYRFYDKALRLQTLYEIERLTNY